MKVYHQCSLRFVHMCSFGPMRILNAAQIVTAWEEITQENKCNHAKELQVKRGGVKAALEALTKSLHSLISNGEHMRHV